MEAIPALYMRTLQELDVVVMKHYEVDRFWKYFEGRLVGLGNECDMDG